MRFFKFLIPAFALVALGIGLQQARAASTTVNTAATIVAPLGIAEQQSLDWGTFATIAADPFSITIDPFAGGLTTSGLDGHFGGQQAGEVDITGGQGGTISMTFVPSELVHTIEGPAVSIQVSDITCSFDGGPTQALGTCVATLNGGSNVMSLGGTISAGGGRTNGVYAGTIAVTANGN